jgi:hypothetical protein
VQLPRWAKHVPLALGVLALGIQLVPVTRSNPPVIRELVWDSPATRALARRACYDCHSNEVTWPWYAHVAPVSWLVAHDVKEARERFNFSEVSADDRAGLLAKQITSGEMPPIEYRAMHPAARLSTQEKSAYVAGLRRSFELSGLGAGKPTD